MANNLHLVGKLQVLRFYKAIFTRRHSCASISTALPDFSLPRNHQPPCGQPLSNILTYTDFEWKRGTYSF
uniref:Uncharacterized protein n=1 Tax=Fagus sylvatica TaxID=28930 RepID=A0A2N9FCR3_FAGSY